MPFATIETRVSGARGDLVLNRPEKLNALDQRALLELVDAARWFDRQPEVKVVVVSGNGRSFSAGADVSGFAAEDSCAGAAAGRGRIAGRRMAEAIEAMGAVTVARIHGHCIGGAVVLAAACDLRVACDSAVFSIPEVDLGIPLAWGGIPRLVREIGPAMTRELVLTCRRFSAAEARELGLLNRVVRRGAARGRRRGARHPAAREVAADAAGHQARRPRGQRADAVHDGRVERCGLAHDRAFGPRLAPQRRGLPAQDVRPRLSARRAVQGSHRTSPNAAAQM